MVFLTKKLSSSSNPYRKLCKGFLLGLVAIMLSAQPERVSAEDAEDLLNVYDMTLGKADASDIANEMQQLENDILSIQSQQAINEEYNAIMQQYIERRQTLINNIAEDVQTYQANNESISKYISSNLLTADITFLTKYDSAYKANNVAINDLLATLNNTDITAIYKNVDFDTSSIEAKLADTKVLYADAIDTYELGDVSNLQWIMPNDKYVTSSFGYRVDPLNSSLIRYHSGTDYRAPIGTPIYALFNGVVTSTGWSDSCGYFVTVTCGDNIKYFICHLSEILVEDGQQITQYDTLALSGGTGSRCTGPHLHIAIYINGCAYDVNQLFKNI